jgi:hypothetical protein
VFTALRKRVRQACLLGCVSGAALLILAVGQASAATYPGGGSTFTGSAEGWTAKAECPPVPLTLLCAAEGKYDGTAGHPAGSLADQTVITLNLLGIFHSEVTETSPTFTAVGGGTGTLSLERQFENAELLSLAPAVEYSAYLVDKTTNTKQKAFAETVENASPFTAKTGAVSLVAGHTYAIEIDATTKSTLLSIGLLGNTTFRVDNVVVTGPNAPETPGGNPGADGNPGANGGNGGEGSEGGAGANGGAGGVSSARLESLIKSSSLVGPAVLKGSRISVKATCPAKVNATCTLSLQGLLSRKKPATAGRKAKVKTGKTKNFVLTVKPAARKVVKTKSKLLFKETVKAGQAKATVYKSIKLIRK